MIMALEPRFMFDGAAAGDAVQALDDSGAESTPDLPGVEAAPARKEVAFVDTQVADYQTLVDGIGAGIEVVVVERGASGLSTMAQWAQSHDGYDAIHILSHGSEGALRLGSDVVTSDTLSQSAVAADLAAIGQSLGADGDLMLYGCAIGDGESGAAFMAGLAQATGADVAASTDATGLGGDWQLERVTGAIETDAISVAGFGNTLVDVTFDFESATGTRTPYGLGSAAKTVSQTNDAAGETLQFTSTAQNVAIDTDTNVVGVGLAGITNDALWNAYWDGYETTTVMSLQSGKQFDLVSFNIFEVNDNSETPTLTTSKGTVSLSALKQSGMSVVVANLSAADQAKLQGITSITFGSADGTYDFAYDDFVINNIVTPDTTPPTFDVAPATSNVAATTVDLSASLDESGTVYYVVLANGSAAPTSDEVIAGTGSGGAGVVASGSQAANTGAFTASFSSIGGLSANTAYSIYVVGRDAAGNKMAAPSQVDVTTLMAAPGTPDLQAASDLGSSSTDNATSDTTPTFDISGTVNGATVTLFNDANSNGTVDSGESLGTATGNGGTVSITASALAAGTYNIKAIQGNATSGSAALSVTIDTTAPVVSSVSVPSNATYISTQNLDFTVNFDGAVNVDTGGGTPRLALDIGGTTKYASYVSGTGTSALVFRYAVESNLSDTNGITVSSLETNSGSIKDTAGNDATLTLNNVAATTAVLVDSTAPAVTSVSVPANATYTATQNLDFTVNFGETVTVNTTGGTPRLALDIGGTTKYASYVSGTGSSALLFRYAVESNLSDTNGITVSSLDTNSGTIKDAAGNDANTTLNSVAATTAVLVDSTAPAVTSVSVPANSIYTASQNMDFTVNFGENVTVDTTGGTPRLALDIGGTTKYASYVSGTGTSALVFRYTVESNLSDTNGITVSSLETNSGTIKDAAGNDANTTLNSVAATTSVLVDSIGPTLSSSTPSDNATGVSPSADIVLNFNENVAKGSGNIVIKRTSDDSVIETIAVGDAKVSVSGAQVTINPDATLADSTEYYVLVESGAITDSHANAFAGISSTTALSFTTTDTTAPLLSTSSPADNATGISTTADIVLNFNENVAKGTGNILIKKTSDNSTVETIDVTSGLVTVSGSQVTINPSTTLAFGTEYYVQVANGAIKDTSNNAYAGIADTTSLSFTTGGPSITGVTGVNGNYKSGQTVDITVTFESAVDVNTTGGTPTLTLGTGGSASYVSGTGTTALVFRYTVGDGQNSADLDYSATSSLALNGGTIVSAGGSTAAVLTLPTPGAAGSLAANQAIVIDTTAPRVTSIDRQNPTGATTNSDSLVFRVSFDSAVSNLDTTDFSVSGTTGTVTNVASIGGNVYDVTVSGGDLANYNGTVALSFAGGQNVTDAAGNALNTTVTGTNNTSYTVDNAAPTVTSITRQTPSTAATKSDTLVWRVTFDGAVSNVDTADFSVSGTTGTVSNVSMVSAGVYDVTVSGGNLASLDGAVALSFAGGQNVADAAGNSLTNTTPSGTNDNSFTVDNTAPNAPTVTATGGTSTTVPVSGTAEPNATISIYDGGALIGTAVADGAGAWSYNATLAVGPHAITATATDAAGNASAVSTAASVTVTSPPTTGGHNNGTVAGGQGGGTPGLPGNDNGGKGDPGPGAGIVTVVRDADTKGDRNGDNGAANTVASAPPAALAPRTPAAGPTQPAAPPAAAPAPSPGDGGGFKVATVAPAGPGQGDALVAVKPVAVVEAAGAQVNFTLPGDTFASTQADAQVQLAATQVDGTALPGWLSFNPQTGTFVGQPPPGVTGEVVVRVIARDQDGREAIATVRINVNAGGGNAAPQGENGQGDGQGNGQGDGAPAPDGGPQEPAGDRVGGLSPAVLPGKPGFMSELRLAGRLAPARQAALLAAARDLARFG